MKENDIIVKNEKNGKYILTIVLLALIILCLIGFICYDKGVFGKKEISSNNNIENNLSDREQNVDKNCANENEQKNVEKNYEQAYNYLVNNLNCSFYDASSSCSDTFYISAKCDNDIIKEIHYDDIVHYRTENSSGIGIEIKTDKETYTNRKLDSEYRDVEYNMDMYYKILKNAGISEMELINGLKYAYEVSEKNNNVVHDPYCD